MKSALFVLLAIYAGASVALAQIAQITPTPIAPRPHSAPELDWALASSALTLLAGVVAIVRGRRNR
jgi:hypothetical protein